MVAPTTASDKLLSRKEVAHRFERDRTTVWRWECDGLTFRDGRITEAEVAWFLELRDAAKTLMVAPRKLIGLDREEQVRYLELALKVRTRLATLCNISGVDEDASSPRRSRAC